MKVFEVIQELQKLDPNEEMYILDSEYGPIKVETLGKNHALYEKESPNVWCFEG